MSESDRYGADLASGFSMPHHDIVTIGASAGGVEALVKLVAELPAKLPAAVCVVVHLPADSISALPQILNRAGPMEAVAAEDCAPIRPGRIYVATPDRHLLLKEGLISAINGPKENRHRPAIDPLFRTAARIYGPRVIGVLLTGASDDGVAGLRAIKARGGLAVVQDPADATLPDLPQSAIDYVDGIDHIVPLSAVALLLERLVQEPAPISAAPANPGLQKEARIAELDLDTIEDDDKPGTPSAFSCPDCGGVLWELERDDLLRFRCRVGHAYTGLALAEEHDEAAERALWAGFRALEEDSSFARRLSVRARRAGHPAAAERFLARAEDAASNAAAIRHIILRLDKIEATDLLNKSQDEPGEAPARPALRQ